MAMQGQLEKSLGRCQLAVVRCWVWLGSLQMESQLEEHTNKSRALQPIPKGTVCLCAAKKVEQIQSLRRERGDTGREREAEGGGKKKEEERIRDGKNKRQAEQEMQMREQKW